MSGECRPPTPDPSPPQERVGGGQRSPSFHVRLSGVTAQPTAALQLETPLAKASRSL